MGDGHTHRPSFAAVVLVALLSGCSTAGAATPSTTSGQSWAPSNQVEWSAWPVWTGAPGAAGLPAEPCKTVSPDFLEDVAPQADTGEPGDSARGELKPGTWIVACSRSEYPLLVGFTYHEAFSDLDDDRAACATAPPSGRIAVPGADTACITYSDDVMAALAVGAHHSLYIAVPDPSASSDVVAAELARLWKLWARAT